MARRETGPQSRHTISVLVENRAGVLAKVAGLFSARGYNIDSLSVGETQDPTVSRITVTATGDAAIIEQITKQLNKLIDVIKVSDLAGGEHVEREMVLIKVNAAPSVRAEVLRISEIFRGKIVDVSPQSYTIELTGDAEKVEAVLQLLKPYGIKEIARTGKVALMRGAKTLTGAREGGPSAAPEKPSPARTPSGEAPGDE